LHDFKIILEIKTFKSQSKKIVDYEKETEKWFMMKKER
jgi:hypothetical protein